MRGSSTMIQIRCRRTDYIGTDVASINQGPYCNMLHKVESGYVQRHWQQFLKCPPSIILNRRHAEYKPNKLPCLKTNSYASTAPFFNKELLSVPAHGSSRFRKIHGVIVARYGNSKWCNAFCSLRQQWSDCL